MKKILVASAASIAMVAHELNRAYCRSIGDDSQPAWDEAPEWQQKSAIAGVEMHLANPDATPEESHQSWLDEKEKAGWTYGETKDVEKKQHPCCLPYDELPQEQKVKDYLFKAAVNYISKLIESLPASEPVAPVLAQVVARTADGTVPVKYVGRRDEWIERKYGTGLTFSKGQVRHLPESLARRLLRHADLFALADLVSDSAGEPESGTDDSSEDDTAEQLAKAQDEKAQRDKEQEDLQGLRDQIMVMDKEALDEFAYTRYQQKINKRRSVENLREEVIGFVDQYGAV